MSNISASIGLGQLQVLTERIEARKRVWLRYKEAFAGIPVCMMPIAPFGEPNFWLTAITLDPKQPISPQDVIRRLGAENIEARPLWKPMELQPVFRGVPYFSHGEDVGADLFSRGLCLPSGSSLSSSEQDRVIETFKSSFSAGIA